MSTSIGKPAPRRDGRAKVTGEARYAADNQLRGMVHGALALSSIPRGRMVRLDTEAAAAQPGVLRILTHENVPRLRAVESPPAGQAVLPLQSADIHYEGEPIALVIAESLEAAQQAAALVRAEYARQPATVDPAAAFARPVRIAKREAFVPSDSRVGDVDAELARAAVRVDVSYRTADRHHAAMEPSATVAVWDGDFLTVYEATQWIWGVRAALSTALGIPPERIRVRSPFTGGGFGCKGFVWPHQFLAPLAARAVGRPVKLTLTRAQTFTAHGHQPASSQSLVLGAEAAGKLVAIRHDAVTLTSMDDDFLEMAAVGTRAMYACPAIVTTHRAARLHRPVPTPMRAPWEGLSMVGLEMAMDELAARLDIDPLELRIRNHADRDPTSGKPFSSKELLACYRRGAERFGWKDRPRRPRSMKDGRDLVGWGMASVLMSTFRFPASARISLERGGEFVIESGTQEIGGGTYTTMPQIAAQALDVAPERIRMVLGDTTLPETGGTFGSSTTVGLGSAVFEAAQKLAAELAVSAGGHMPRDAAALDAVLDRAGAARVSAEADWTPGKDAGPLGDPPGAAMSTFGALFAEVRVDESLCIPRVSRMVGVYSVGTVVNPRTAKSQMTGGMIWGIGQALLERSVTELTLGRFLSKNLAGYLVPVSLDVPDLTAEFIDENDRQASAFGGKGIGELGAVGVAPAIANAIWHATGIRVRELPITPEKLLVG